jgi:hypothetical protein
MSNGETNIFFLGVGRLEGREGIVVASFSNNVETDLDGVINVLQQPTTTMVAGKHYSFTVESTAAWHLIAGTAFCFSADPLCTAN